MQKFTAELIPVAGMNAAYVNIPFDVQEVYGTKGRVKVKAKIDGVIYRGSIVCMKKGTPHILIVTQAVRQAIGKKPGNKISVILQKDTAERIIDVPEDLQKLLNKNKAAHEYFSQLSYTNRKEYVRWIESAKRPETRNNRLHLTLEKLLAKQKNPSAK